MSGQCNQQADGATCEFDPMYLFVELEPGLVVLGVGVLQPEEPDLPEADGFDDLLWF